MTNVLVYVTTEDGTTINTTENHPFYVEGKGWCAAAELEAGDVCRTKDGQVEVVAGVVIEQQEEPVKVYNLTIEDNRTYYVSMHEMLVHNDCFNKGELYEDKLIVDGIEVEAIAEVDIDGDTLILKNIAIYVNGGDFKGQIGLKNIMEWVKSIMQKAKDEEFSKLKLEGTRVQNSSFANPGHIIDMLLDL